MTKVTDVKVGLDIGHGNDSFPPSKGVYRNGTGYAEFDFNNKLAKHIKILLEAHGVEVVMAQPFDAKEVPLRTRSDFYEREKVDVIVSIHANYNNDPAAEGRCVFSFKGNAEGRRLAERIINEIKAKGYSTHGNGLHLSIPGTWSNFHILREPNKVGIPAVLIEHGFMGNPSDFDLIFGRRQGEYVDDMAEADTKAILNHFGIVYQKGQKQPDPEVSENPDHLYRVQVGAFRKKESAERLAKELNEKGYPIYMPPVDALDSPVADRVPDPPKPAPKPAPKPTPAPDPHRGKSDDELAHEVIANRHGNGDARKASLGSRFTLVQRRVNAIYAMTDQQLAHEIAKGVGAWGVGDERKAKLKNAGRNYKTVQTLVNRILQ